MCFLASPPIISKGLVKGGDKMAKNTRCRSAITGRFVKESYANKNPKTTVKETVKKQSK